MSDHEFEAELLGDVQTATAMPLPDPDEPDEQIRPVKGPYQVRRVHAWFGTYDQHIVGGVVVDPDTVEVHDEPEDA